MARQDKYYGTYTMIYGNKLKKLKELGYEGHHAQFRVVCKAKSMAEANRIAESFGFTNKCFLRDYTSETGNELEIEMVNKYGFIVCLGGTLGEDFVDIKEIL